MKPVVRSHVHGSPNSGAGGRERAPGTSPCPQRGNRLQMLPLVRNPLISPRRNQECCNAECREAWERSKRSRRKQAAANKPKGVCLWCDGSFDQVRRRQEFCCSDHQQAFNNFWKGKGPVLAKALHAWRVGKVIGGLTQVCREFSHARDELKHKQAKAQAETKGKKR